MDILKHEIRLNNEEAFAMRKKISRIIAVMMLIFAVIFIVYALNHPEASFTWDNSITYAIYVLYGIIMMFMFIAPFRGK